MATLSTVINILNIFSTAVGKMTASMDSLTGSISKAADSYMYTSAKLALISGGEQDDGWLQDKVFAAAMRSRGSYTDVATDILKMGTINKSLFNDNDELITFTELARKALIIGGADPEKRRTGIEQIVQSMTAGGLQGDDFMILMKTAPVIAEAISKFTGESITNLMDMSKQGDITADIIKRSIFDMSRDINDRFKAMPMTFADVFTKVKESAMHAFGPVFEKLGTLMRSPIFQEALDRILGAINIIAAGIDAVVGFIQSNWSTIGPILSSIIGALTLIALVYLPMILILWVAINWPILLAVTAIGLLLYVMINFGDTIKEVFGYIGGAIGVFIALIYDLIAVVINMIVSEGDFVVNLFIDKINSIIAWINLAVERLNSIFGENIGFIGKLEYVEGPKLEYMDIGKAFTKGQAFGSAPVSDVQDILNKLLEMVKIPDGPEVPSVDKYVKDGAVQVTGKGGGNLKVDMNEEDLKYLQDIAEREYINNFSTATLAPNVSISFGNVSKEVDVDNVVRRVGKIMREEIAMASEGGYVI